MDARIATIGLLLCAPLMQGGCAMFDAWAEYQARRAAPAQSPVTVISEPELAASAPPQAPAPVTTAEDQLILDYVNVVGDAARRAPARPPVYDDSGLPARYEPPPQGRPVVAAPAPVAEPTPQPTYTERRTTTIDLGAKSAPAPRNEPPVLGEVAVNRATRPILVAPAGRGTGSPSANNGAVAIEPPVSFEEMVGRYFTDSPGDSFRGQLDARVARVLAGDYGGARKPLQLVTNQQQVMASRLIETLIIAREEFHLGAPSDGVGKALAEVGPLVDQLRDASDLAIPSFLICRRVSGFGDYLPIEPAEFRTGLPAAFATYAEIANLVSEARPDGFYYAELSMTTNVLTRDGDSVAAFNDGLITDKCRQRRNDFFIAREIHLPATLAPGEYVVKVTLKDKLGQKVAENRTTFRVTAG